MRLNTRTIPLGEATSTYLAEWQALAEDCIEPNIFLSPSFVIPAVRHLRPERQPNVLLVEDASETGTSKLRGLMLLEDIRMGRVAPFRHFRSYRTLHTFTDGVLISQVGPLSTAQAIFDYLLSTRPTRHAIGFDLLPTEGPVFRLLLEAAGTRGMQWFALREFARAVADLDSDLPTRIKRSVRKDVGRNLKRLMECGKVQRKLHFGLDFDTKSIERHLVLENMGWKANKGTSMLSRPNEAMFFREMSENLCKEGRAVFLELQLDDDVIASISNYACGGNVFSFKIGWNPAYARFGPGLIANLELLDALGCGFRSISRFDSSTAGPSYLDRLLPDRRRIASGYFSLTDLGKQWLHLASRTWRAKQRLGESFSKQ